MANSIAFASKYLGELDKMIVQGAKTGFLADNALKAKFSGSKTVYLSELTLEGMGDYSRTTGYSKGDVNLVNTPYTLSMERSKQLFMDEQDADESGVADLIGKMVGEYTRTQVIPELDAYNISKLYGVAATAGNTKEYAEKTALKDFLSLINAAEAATEYSDMPLVSFIDPTLWAAIQTSDELSRKIVVSDFKQGEIDMKVKKLNGCVLIPVSAARMKSEYTFGDSGFTPAADAKDIRALVLPKDAGHFVKKVDKCQVLTPEEVEDYDAYKINFRMYYDTFVKSSRDGTIFALHTTPTE